MSATVHEKKPVSEHSSWRRVEELAGVRAVESQLVKEETGEVDEKDRPVIRCKLTALAQLEDGRTVRAEAVDARKLEDLLLKRVKAALAEKRAPAALAK